MNTPLDDPSRHAPWERRFAKELKRLRAASGLSLYALARDLTTKDQSFHQQQIDRIEREERTVRLNEAMRIAAYFNTTLDQMVRVPSERRADVSKLAARSHNLAITAENRLKEFRNSCLALVAFTGEGDSLIRQLAEYDDSEREPGEDLLIAIHALASMLDGLAEAAKSALSETAQVTVKADASSTLLIEWRSTPPEGGAG